MTQPPRLHLFQAYGIELEYMVVDRDTLRVLPMVDEVLKEELGAYGSDFENGLVTWSNELVLHVIELKSTRPEANLNGLDHAFHENVKRVNAHLQKHNAILMPGAAHPFMDPATETRLWPHDNNDVYEIYNRIFNCSGHGWSNLQSTHLNLPFYDDQEFAKLHAAVRILLPLLPALCASSPILDGAPTGKRDTRLTFYRTNQSRLPSITGKVIPEAVFSKRNYINLIYEKIKSDIAPFDSGNVLNPIWVNSRGAIPRFDRGSIEIRVMDIQECPSADLAIVSLVIETLKCLVQETIVDFETQMRWKTEPLAQIFERAIDHGEETVIDNPDYLRTFGCNEQRMTAAELWQFLLEKITSSGNRVIGHWRKEIEIILQQGTLSKRITDALRDGHSAENIRNVYRRLADCLSQNRMFIN